MVVAQQRLLTVSRERRRVRAAEEKVRDVSGAGGRAPAPLEVDEDDVWGGGARADMATVAACAALGRGDCSRIERGACTLRFAATATAYSEEQVRSLGIAVNERAPWRGLKCSADARGGCRERSHTRGVTRGVEVTQLGNRGAKRGEGGGDARDVDTRAQRLAPPTPDWPQAWRRASASAA